MPNQQISPPFACPKCGVGDAAATFEDETGRTFDQCTNPNCAQDAALRLMPSKFIEVVKRQNIILDRVTNVLTEIHKAIRNKK